MGTPIPGKDGLYIETGPWVLWVPAITEWINTPFALMTLWVQCETIHLSWNGDGHYWVVMTLRNNIPLNTNIWSRKKFLMNIILWEGVDGMSISVGIKWNERWLNFPREYQQVLTLCLEFQFNGTLQMHVVTALCLCHACLPFGKLEYDL